ncbi:ABC transporter permease [Clostridium sardiniense]|uniref:ABC transporter permease n=1 Tax=Clostridium sardiniense TaxID=29369 RepID=UPI00195605D7|nr:ABC transporter permease [Clostridium sardiniense]MBM7834082.1 ABC-type polysaccharide/polyol phosphate export permease [Clostridium sardiniense]
MLKTIVLENIRNIKQTILISKADLVKFYKGAALGYAWAVIRPMVTIAVYLFAFQMGIRKSGYVDGFPFLLWLIAGLGPWFFISDAIVGGAMSIRQYRHFVTKMKFPISTIPTFVLLSKLYVQIMLLAFIVLIFAAYGYYPDIYYLQFLYYIPTMYIFFLVLSWTLSSLSVISRDFENLVKAAIQAVLWLTPILWNIRGLSPTMKFIMKLNPVNYFIEGFRDIFLYKEWFFQGTYSIYIWIVILITALIGSHVYKKLYKDFTDVL